MFGRGWEPGEAKIVALKEIRSVGRFGGMDSGSGAKMKTYDFVADVQPAAGGAVFRTVIHEPFDERVWSRPSVGDVVAVKCDPRRQKAKFDTAVDAAQKQADKEATKRERVAQAAQFDAMIEAAPGTAAPSPATDGGRAAGGPHGDQPDPRVRRVRVAVREARRKGDAAEVERLTAQLEQLEHGSTLAPSPSRDSSGAESIEQRMAKLQQLSDDGVLTPDEYAAQRQRILESL